MKQEDKSSNHCYIFIKCLIILAFLLWVTGEDRLIVRRAKIWSWVYNFVEQMEKITILHRRKPSPTHAGRYPELDESFGFTGKGQNQKNSSRLYISGI